MSARMEQLRRKYVATLEPRLTGVEAALREADADALEEARRVAHQLRGTAASYGFPALGQACADLEEALRAALDRGASEERLALAQAALARAWAALPPSGPPRAPTASG